MAKDSYQLGQANLNNRGGGPRMRAAEKPKDMKNALKLLANYLKRYMPRLCVAFGCSIVAVILSVFTPDKLRSITDIIEKGMKSGAVDTDAVVRISILVLCLYALSAIMTLIQSLVLTDTTQDIMMGMRSDISRKMNRLPLSCFDGSSFGDILSRVTNDVDTIGRSLHHAAADLVTAVTTFVGCLVMMLLCNVTLCIIAVVSSLVGLLIMKAIVKRSQKYFSARQKVLGALNGHIEEMYAGHLIEKAFNGEKASKETFDALNEMLYENTWKSRFMSGIMRPIMDFVANFGYVAVCVVGALMVRKESIGFGVIIAFILYVKLFTQPLGMVAQSVTSIQSAAAAAERVFAFLSQEEMEDESGKPRQLETCRGEVEFRHVNFGYVPEKTIINDFSVKIEPGQNVAIVGPTGAGKTTLVNLLMRFYEVNSGEILIDGVSTRDMTRDEVHDLFSMVLQDTWLFEGTIKENIKYSKHDASDEDVVAACKAVGLHHFIESLHDGYDTVLSDNTNISAGQKQLMTIARAMVEDAPLLILDEATSSVDTRTEQIVQDAMNELTKGRTSFTIAHRLSTIRNADLILVMKDGDIVETGNHKELLEKGGFYADLWTSQFTNNEQL